MMIATSFRVIRVDGSTEDGVMHMPEKALRAVVRDFVRGYLNDEPPAHVPVFEDVVKDMFVSDLGHLRLTQREPLGFNSKATALYRALLSRGSHRGQDPDTMPTIAGPAVVFDQRVW